MIVRWMTVTAILASFGCAVDRDEAGDDPQLCVLDPSGRGLGVCGGEDDMPEAPAPTPTPEPEPAPEPLPPRMPRPDDACHDLGEPCAFEGDCCIHPDGALVCVADEHGDASCHAGCETDDDCDTGCCVPLHGGASACMPAAECAHRCAPLGDACEVDTECCAGSQCIAGQCSARCDDDASCPTDCCDASGTCAPAEHCGGEPGCADGTHFCRDGNEMFECDGARWYGFDCEVACIEAGWGGSSGCQWSDLWEDDACVCSAA